MHEEAHSQDVGQPHHQRCPGTPTVTAGQRLKIRLWNKDPEHHVFRALVEGKMYFEETVECSEKPE